MDLLLKIGLTPLLIGAASLAGRRWGAVVGGWLIALPLTSGPVAFFVALDEGPRFAAVEAGGSLLGVLAIAAFALTYAWIARSAGWPPAAGGASATFLLVGLVGQPLVGLPPVALLGLVLAGLVAASLALPRLHDGRARGAAPWWEIPGRIVAGTLIVVSLTAAAAALGPGPSGVIAIFPAFAAILTIFTHRRDGAAEALAVLRGLLIGLVGTATFFALLEAGLGPLGVEGGMLAAVAGGAVVQGLALLRLRAGARHGRATSVSIAAR